MENSPALLDGLEVLEKRLLSKDRVFTVGDAAAITGYQTDQAKQLLDRLIAKYDCKLKITQDGDLIYDFGSYPHKRGERTWAEWSHGVKKWSWKAFVFFFKLWIAVTLVVYFLIFLFILIAIIIAALASNKNDDDGGKIDIGEGFGGFLKILGDIFSSVFRWNTHYQTTHYTIDSWGYQYQEYDHHRSPTNRKKKGFVASVYDFVFGPERVEINPLANQKEAGSYIRAQKGLIIVPEVIALAGWKGGEAENFLSELVVRYQGEAKISQESVLYGDFTDFARQKTTQDESKIIWYWDEYEPEYKLTGNSFWRNAGITFMCAFNLVFAGIFVFAHLNPERSMFNFSSDDTALFIFLGWIPFLFSVIFFGVPVMRWLNIGFLRRKRRMANVRKRVMKAIYLNNKEIISLEELKKAVNQANDVEKLSEEDVTYAMNEMIVDFYGDIDFDENGKTIYKFTRLREELKEARKLRGQQNLDLGKIVFETE